MIRRTSGSSIVRHVRACGANGAVPLTMARAIELSVRTWRPGRSGVRSRISSCARLLNATRLSAPLGTFHCCRRCRARSVSTRVLPDPAGAMMRAAPPGWVTAASWSGARSASDRLGPGTGERPLLDRHDVHDGDTVDRLGVAERPSVDPHGRAVGRPPRLREIRRHPPTHRPRPRDRARSRSGDRGRGKSTVFDHTRWWSSSSSKPNRGPRSNGASVVATDGVCSKSVSSSTTSRSRSIAARRRRAQTSVGAASVVRGDPDAFGREPRCGCRSVREHEGVAGEGVGPGLRRGDAACDCRRRSDLAARSAGGTVRRSSDFGRPEIIWRVRLDVGRHIGPFRLHVRPSAIVPALPDLRGRVVHTPAVRTRDRHRPDHSDRGADRTRVRSRRRPRSCTLWIDG